MKKLGFFAVLLSCAMFIGCEKKADTTNTPADQPAAEATSDAAGTEEAAPAAEEAPAA